jgi:MFS family permease
MSGQNTAMAGLSLTRQTVLLMCGIPATLIFTSLAPILPKMEAALAHDATDQMLVRMVVGINGIAMVFGAPLAGLLADRYGRIPLIVAAMTFWAVFGCSGYFISDLYLMVATRFLTAMMGATSLTVGLTMIGDLPDENARNRLLGINVSISIIASTVTVPISGFLGDIHWRLPFLTFALSLPLAALTYYAFRGYSSRPVAVARAAGAPKERVPIPYMLLFLALFTGSTTFTVFTYMPFEFRNMGISSSSQIAMALTAETMTSAVVAGIFGYARRYMSSQLAFATSFLFCTLGMPVAAFAPTFGLKVAGLILTGAGIAWLAPNVMARAAAAATPATRGRVVGLVKGVHMCASFIAVLLLEPVMRAYGPRGVLTVMTVVAAGTAVANFYRHVTTRPSAAAPQPVPGG